MFTEIIRRYISVILIFFIIRALDKTAEDNDLSDVVIYRLLDRLGSYLIPYSMLTIVIAIMLDKDYAFTLFTSASILGMLKLPYDKPPYKISKIKKFFLLFVLSLLLAPPLIFFHAFLIMVILILLEDLIYYDYDFMYGEYNYAVRFGKVEVIISIAILLTAAVMVSWVSALIILPTGFLINYLYSI